MGDNMASKTPVTIRKRKTCKHPMRFLNRCKNCPKR